jgi:PhzF family phenazine biosynthesis protein
VPRPIYIVDAFTDTPFRGNPAAVVLLEPEDGPASDSYMQSVAAEMNLSETAFVSFDPHLGPNHFGLRWFTPVREVDLCGHATLASAQVLYDAAKVDLHTPILFDTASGQLRAAPDARYGGFTLDFPATPPEVVDQVPPGLLPALRLDGGQDGVKFVGRSTFDWFVEVARPDIVRGLAPDFEALKRIETRGAIVSAAGDGDTGADVVSRCFYPAYGIDEDPVTGSAHCCIGPYFVRTLGKATLQCHQASRRGGSMKVRVEQDRVFMTGQARSVIRGELLV